MNYERAQQAKSLVTQAVMGLMLVVIGRVLNAGLVLIGLTPSTVSDLVIICINIITGLALAGSVVCITLAGYIFMTPGMTSGFAQALPAPKRDTNHFWDEGLPATVREPTPEERKREVEARDRQELVDWQRKLDRSFPPKDGERNVNNLGLIDTSLRHVTHRPVIVAAEVVDTLEKAEAEIARKYRNV